MKIVYIKDKNSQNIQFFIGDQKSKETYNLSYENNSILIKRE